MSIVEDLIAHPGFKEGVYWKLVNYKKDEKIVEQGDESQDLYLLKRGSARVLGSVEIKNKRRIQPGVCDIGAGGVFGELSLFDNQPRSATIVCLEDCDVIVIDGAKISQFLEENTDLGYRFMREMMEVLVKRLRVSNEKIFSLFAWGLKAHKIDEHLP